MKTNEAPEKIYLCPSELAGIDYDEEWYEYPCGDNNIEYIRKDAFIEKACKLLARMIWEVTYEDLEGNSTEHHDKMEFIEDFKKYMEE